MTTRLEDDNENIPTPTEIEEMSEEKVKELYQNLHKKLRLGTPEEAGRASKVVNQVSLCLIDKFNYEKEELEELREMKDKDEIAEEIKQEAEEAENGEELLEVIQKAKEEIKTYEGI